MDKINLGNYSSKLINRFWSKVDKKEEDSCWNWLARLDEFGYGEFVFDGHTRRAHQYSYKRLYGNPEPGRFICHSCNNSKCVNPNHLYLGDAQTNADDRVLAGTMPKGSNHYNSIITEDLIIEMLNRINLNYFNSTLTCATHYNILPETIRGILNRQNWKHITNNYSDVYLLSLKKKLYKQLSQNRM